jgi:copper transport protein
MSSRRLRRLSLLAAAAAALAAPAAVFAHARLVQSLPRDGAVLATGPAAVRLVFDDVVQPAGGDAVVRNDGSVPVLAGPARVEHAGRVLVLPLRQPLRRGDYSVRWRVLSDDGHFVSGVSTFAVGTGRAPAASVLAASSGEPRAIDVLARWLYFAGLLLAAGVAFFSVAVLRGRVGLAQSRLAVLVIAGCTLFAAGAEQLVHDTGWSTRFGLTVHIGLVVAVAAAASASLSFAYEIFLVPALAGAGALVLVPPVAGHALDAGRPAWSVVADAAHVAAAALWIGVLVGVVAVLPAAGGLASAALRRVSALALASVLVLGATGIARAWYEVASLRHLWDTGYGRALLVKTTLLVALVAIGWLTRRGLELERLRRTVPVELVLLAGVVVAVAFLTQLRPGRDTPRAAAAAPAQATLQPPPRPPRGALVLAQEDRSLAVALAVQPQTLTASVLAPTGGGANGLDVAFAVPGHKPVRATVCGTGCYRAALAARGEVRVLVGNSAVAFAVPARAAPAAAFVRRATRAFRQLRSVVYVERLASSPTNRIVTTWRLAAPNRLSYTIHGGASAIAIGSRRWDRQRGGRWVFSQISPLDLPAPPWGTSVTNAHLLERTGRVVVVSWTNPEIPAWFTARFDSRTLRPISLRMTAAAHFMRHRYVSFNRPLGIRPPTSSR